MHHASLCWQLCMICPSGVHDEVPHYCGSKRRQLYYHIKALHWRKIIIQLHNNMTEYGKILDGSFQTLDHVYCFCYIG